VRDESALQTTYGGGRAPVLDLHALSAGSDANGSACSMAPSAERVGHLVRRAMKFLESDRQAARRCLDDASKLLGVDSLDAGTSTSVPVIPQGFRSGGLARWQVQRALAFIDANLGSKMNIRQLAGLVSFSKSHFSRAFKRSLGLPPMAYVAAQRIERAKLMMASTREQLTQIALACGFADQPHLNRSFRRVAGMTPGAWRRTRAEK
jgi:AraC family transcriptional regulator